MIGGGPAGSSCAGLLAKEGHKVLVVEREKFPLPHRKVPDSRMPAGDRGARHAERIDQYGFTRKYGGILLWGKTHGVWDFRFADGGRYEYSYQVRRADFDALLLTRARELGARVIEEATVKDVVFDGDRAVGVRYVTKGRDQPVEVQSRFVVDASGQGRVLGRNFDLVEWHEDLRNIAVWGY